MTNKLDLRHKLVRPDECISHLEKELIKTGTKKSKAYKCWEDMMNYIDYLEAKLKRKDANFKRMKETIKNLKEMTE